jgi:hypothetical protein
MRLVELPLIPVAINAHGEVLGLDAAHRAARWSASGGLEELPLPAGFDHSEPVAINAQGTSVAVGIASDPAGTQRRAYVVAEEGAAGASPPSPRPGPPTVGALLGGVAARPFRIDDAGTVVGEALVPGHARSEPVLWNTQADARGATVDEGPLPRGTSLELAPRALGSCCGGTAKVLDGQGTIAGDAYDEAGRYQAFRWREGGGLERIDTEDRFSSALAMNHLGHVLIVAFPKILLAGAQGLERLKLAPKGPSHPHALNDCDVIVGDFGPFADAARAFAWDRAQGFTDLNTFLPPGAALKLKSALDLNDRGEIIGRAEAPGEVVRGFLLEPGSR